MNTRSPVPLRSRSLRFRCSALAWAVAVAIGLLGDALGDRACSHHETDGHAAHGVEHGGHDGHGHAHQDHAADGSEHGHDGHANPCLCLGSCQAGSAVALGEFPTQALGAAIAGTPTGRVRASTDDLPGRAPFVLPFAHGPPHVA